MLWNTFLGGGGSDFGRSITMDSLGNVYIVGESIVPSGVTKGVSSGKKMSFVTKLNNEGILRWRIFLGDR